MTTDLREGDLVRFKIGSTIWRVISVRDNGTVGLDRGWGSMLPHVGWQSGLVLVHRPKPGEHLCPHCFTTIGREEPRDAG